MIDYEEVVEAIWRYDIPRIDIDEDVTTLYADGKAFAQVIRRPDGSREDLYFEDADERGRRYEGLHPAHYGSQ